MNNHYKYVLATQCFTYNQAPYIRKTLHGFSIQKTHFPVVYCIVDDASTDGEPEVLKNWVAEHLISDDGHLSWEHEPYGEIAVGVLASQPLATVVVLLLAENHYSKGEGKKRLDYISAWCDSAKYIAFCEGDDYWIDADKIRKQTDIMENNPNVQLVYSSFKTINENGEGIYRPMYEAFKVRSISGEVLYRLLRSNFIMTLTVCMRNYLLNRDLYLNCPVRMDWSTFLAAAMYGDICYIPEEMGCYRKVGSSMVNAHRDIVDQRGVIIRDYYSSQFLIGNYKKVSFRQKCKIYSAIAANTINDRRWRILFDGFRRPCFLVVFLVIFFEHAVKKCFKICSKAINKRSFRYA